MELPRLADLGCWIRARLFPFRYGPPPDDPLEQPRGQAWYAMGTPLSTIFTRRLALGLYLAGTS
jgi:hypothetical protein